MDGIERIKVLSSEIKDEATLEIINHLLSRTDMNEKYLNEEKTLKQMIEFIKKEAQKKATDNMAMVNDDVVFGWAIHYWDETNEDLGLIKNDKKENKPLNEIIDVQPNEIKIKANDIKIITPDNEVKTLNKKEWVAEGQLTLF